MNNPEHPFTRIRLLVEQLQKLEPDNPLLKFAPYVLGDIGRSHEYWQEYQTLFNPDEKRTMPEVDDLYCHALNAAIRKKEGKLNGSAQH